MTKEEFKDYVTRKISSGFISHSEIANRIFDIFPELSNNTTAGQELLTMKETEKQAEITNLEIRLALLKGA